MPDADSQPLASIPPYRRSDATLRCDSDGATPVAHKRAVVLEAPAPPQVTSNAAVVLAKLVRQLRPILTEGSGGPIIDTQPRGMTTFAAYLRTSTDDHQSPEDSAAWQLRLARQLIAPAGGEIVATYHDVDQSRSLPWERRPEAAQLLDDLRDPARGWSDLVIAEPQRAFAGSQFGLVFPVLVHYDVNLWVPEVGGRLDPDSEAHDLLMSLFGGLAKAERNRIRHRVRAAMAAHAESGRWLGGRPPYGYVLVDAGPHPNPEKAASGVHLRCLEPDPVTAPIVRRIFGLYVDGDLGFKAIAGVLDTDGMPSPSAHDPSRNSHRPGHAWAASAVRAIICNPRYLGRQVFGRQRRHELLVDPAQPALGHESRMRWQDEGDWVISDEPTHQPLVDETTWPRAQQLMSERARGNGGGSPRADAGRYALVGLIQCSHCGRRMQGSHTRGHPMYRCRLASSDFARTPDDHPRSMAVREDRILPVLDDWLVGLFAPDRVHVLAEQVLEADRQASAHSVAVAQAQRAIAEARRKMERHLAGLEAGIDPDLIAERTRKAQLEIVAAEAILNSTPNDPMPLTLDEIVDTLQALHNVPRLLQAADATTRAELYRALGITLSYRRDADGEFVQVHAQLESVDLNRVGGPSPRPGARTDRRVPHRSCRGHPHARTSTGAGGDVRPVLPLDRSGAGDRCAVGPPRTRRRHRPRHPRHRRSTAARGPR